MRLEITGSIDPQYLEDTVARAAGAWFNKLAADNPEMAEAIDNMEIMLSAVTLDLKFKPEGADEWQVITTDNHEGIAELLVVKAETDDDGNLLWDTVRDNDGNSDFNEFDALIARGLPTEQKTVESKYSSDDLLHKEHFILSDSHWVDISVDAADNVVVQAWHQDMEGAMSQTLIAEVAFPPESLDEVLSHYSELAVSVA